MLLLSTYIDGKVRPLFLPSGIPIGSPAAVGGERFEQAVKEAESLIAKDTAARDAVSQELDKETVRARAE